MEAVRDGAMFALRSPKTGEVMREVDARQLWQRILETRLQTGEPYLLFIDTVNRALPKHQRELGLKVSTSNLCSEIMLPTGLDHRDEERTAVCCLSSLNLETWDAVERRAGLHRGRDAHARQCADAFHHGRARQHGARALFGAARALGRPRRDGLSFVPAGARAFRSKARWRNPGTCNIFRKIRREADAASVALAQRARRLPRCAERGMKARFSHKIAIAPTASISIICGGTSACIEPIPANIYNHKTLSGALSCAIRIWRSCWRTRAPTRRRSGSRSSSMKARCSISTALSDDEKAVFRTAFEIDQRWIIDLAADRAPFICQSQSINLYLPADIDKWDLHMLHWTAWKRGIKSLYYCRSKSISPRRLSPASSRKSPSSTRRRRPRTDYEECLACQ